MTVRILLSYHYLRDDLGPFLTRLQPKPAGVFGDSGAYSAETQGAPIDINQYGKWCQLNKSNLEVYSNLDVIGDPKATWANQQRLEQDFGLHPLPVFHFGSPWDELDRYLSLGYRYIALGGLVTRSRGEAMRWLIKAFQMAEGKAGYHGFGMTQWSILRQLPFYSVDSSSWGSSFRYGVIRVFDDVAGKFIEINLGDRRRVYDHAQLFRKHGADPAVFADRSKYKRIYAVAIGAVAWHRAGTWWRNRHYPVPIEGRETGPHLYLADTNVKTLAEACRAIAAYDRGEPLSTVKPMQGEGKE